MISLSKICYTVCMVCIVLGTLLAIVQIWAGLDNVAAWKGMGTLAVLFCASLITLAVHSAFFSTLGRGAREERTREERTRDERTRERAQRDLGDDDEDHPRRPRRG